MLNMHVDLLKYALNEQQKIYNTKIIESAKLIEQLITIFTCDKYVIKIPPTFIRLIAQCDIYVTTISL